MAENEEIKRGFRNVIIEKISDERLDLPIVPNLAYATNGSAGFDLRAYLHKDLYDVVEGQLKDGFKTYVSSNNIDGTFSITIYPEGRCLVKTGIKIQIPYKHELQIRPRSGLAFIEGITLLNSPGTLDSDYRGDIGIILINHSNKEVIINHGDRIAQGILAKYEKANFISGKVNDTKRGTGGFGHTGKN